MDLYEARRQVVQRLINTLFDRKAAAFSEATGISPTYVTRMLKAEGEPSKKRIGDDMALRLEGVAALKLLPGELVSPTLMTRAEPSQSGGNA